MKLVLLKADLAPVTKELARIADCLEAFLALQGYHMRPPKADETGEAPDVVYVDELKEALREFAEASGLPFKEAEEKEKV